jgi:hypothetical protein
MSCLFIRERSVRTYGSFNAANNPDDRSSLARIIITLKRLWDVKKVKLLEQGRPYVESILDEVPLVKPLMDLLDSIKGISPSKALTEYLNRPATEDCSEGHGSIYDPSFAECGSSFQ